jgi:hypothetical protein
MFETEYSNEQIKADIVFLKFAIKKNQVTLNPNTGLGKLITDAQNYVINGHRTDEGLKACTVLFTLVSSLKTLWISGADFKIQLRAMNTGTFEYGQVDPDRQHFFKDFEFEVFCAAHLNRAGVQIYLPQNTTGEDLVFKGIDLQCKHPTTINQVEQNIRDFSSRLNSNTRYGIFGLAVDDCLNYAGRLTFSSEQELNEHFKNLSGINEQILQQLFENTLARATRVLGLFTTASFFVKIDNVGLRMLRLTNSVFCFRADRNEITDDIYRQAFMILTKFNPQPSWLTIERQTLVSVN